MTKCSWRYAFWGCAPLFSLGLMASSGWACDGGGHESGAAVAVPAPRVAASGDAVEHSSQATQPPHASDNTTEIEPGTVPASVAAGSATAAPGLRVYIDPETGEFTAPPAMPLGESGQQPRAVQPAPEPVLEAVPAPGGGMMVDLRGRFQVYSVATKQADGTISSVCVRSEQAGDDAVGGTAGGTDE